MIPYSLHDLSLNTPAEINTFFLDCCQHNDAASLNDLLSVEHFRMSINPYIKYHGFNCAVECGHTSILSSAFEQSGFEWYHFPITNIEKSICYAISKNKINTIQYLLQHNNAPKKFPTTTIINAALYADFWGLFDYLYTQHSHIINESDGQKLFHDACQNASYNVALGILQFHNSHIDFQKSMYSITWACSTNRTNIVMTMMQHLWRFDPMEYHSQLPTVQCYLATHETNVVLPHLNTPSQSCDESLLMW